MLDFLIKMMYSNKLMRKKKLQERSGRKSLDLHLQEHYKDLKDPIIL